VPNQELVAEAQVILKALEAVYFKNERFQVESLATAEAFSLRMQKMCIHFYRVNQELLCFQLESKLVQSKDHPSVSKSR
jgi:hypothetical protein